MMPLGYELISWRYIEYSRGLQNVKDLKCYPNCHETFVKNTSRFFKLMISVEYKSEKNPCSN